jgi:hypothetical protein
VSVSALVAPATTCQRLRVNSRRLISLLLVVLALAQAGCAYTNNPFTRHRYYRRVHITDFQGYLVADWIAEGPVWSYSPGYRFRAVERRSGGPIPVVSRYPNGHNVKVSGENIAIMPCEKPLWLKQLDGF